MKKQFIKITFYGLSAIALLFQTSCKKDYVNPNAATGQQVFSSPQGLTGVASGLQRVYTAGRASNLYNRVNINGLLTSEMSVLNQGNTGEYQLQQGGGSVDGTNTLDAGLWTSSNKIIYDANNVIAGAQGLADKGYASGLIGYASIFKALAIGDLSMFWQKVPDGVGLNVNFIDRMQGYANAIAVIDNALTAISTNAISASFLANIPAGIDIPNTLHALKARFSLFAGNYTQAMTEANAASLTVKSVFNFSTVNLNPIFETVTSTNNVTAAIDTTTLGLPVGLQPDPTDNRLKFYTTSTYNSKVLGFGAGTITPWPVYLPGEMILIKAEAYARQSTPDLTNALAQLNLVVTKTPASDPYGVGANLPALVGPYTQAQLLDQIYKHRCIELYMAGFKLEDMRRFGRPDSEKKRNLLPYPFQERDNNPNTPPDPTF
ncbi:MAG: RagB/SusD family nutrient uptake outer membrane protein [Bacteroidetes bacterium]|nr:RagB/SusD family nutrient uptake outer membrane protein [Bacteroidota bacterium]MBS1931336.1 RagB/SusD family nutrient uptake outer membrane protein [Bacteroidota bacterium]